MHLKMAILYVKDFDRMAAFYQTLGLKAIGESRTESWVEFEGGFALHAIPPAIAEGIDVSRRREETPIKLCFAVSRSRFESLGVEVVERTWGGYDGVDPEGNVFGIEWAE